MAVDVINMLPKDDTPIYRKIIPAYSNERTLTITFQNAKDAVLLMTQGNGKPCIGAATLQAFTGVGSSISYASTTNLTATYNLNSWIGAIQAISLKDFTFTLS